MRTTIAALIVLIGFVSAAAAQTRPFEPYITVTSAFDSNIEHDRDDLDSLGGVFGGGFVFRDRPVDPSFELNGEVAAHSWTNTDRWDRFSERIAASLERDLPQRWRIDTSAEISLKGSSEDRELSDDYVVIPGVAYRFDAQRRLRGYVGLRARRYDEDPGRNAFNRYFGAEFTSRDDLDQRFEAEVRYEVNETVAAIRQYNRWTLGAGYGAPAGRGRIETELRYRRQYYPFRLVDVPGPDVNRLDHRLIPRVAFTYPVSPVFDLRLGYTLETRSSTDPDRDFTAHLFSFTMRRRW